MAEIITKQKGGTTLSLCHHGGYVQVLGERVIVLCDKTRALNRINVEKLSKRESALEAHRESL